MRTISVRTVSVACALSLLAGGAVLAQDQPTAVLNTLELRQLVERAEPADHVRLTAHFGALADRYAAEAKQHERMAQASTGQAGKSSNAGLAAHCRSLAKADRELEKGARALAGFHKDRAAGAPVAAPANTRGLESGVGASKPKAEELADFAAKAAETNDHRALADYFTTLANRSQCGTIPAGRDGAALRSVGQDGPRRGEGIADGGRDAHAAARYSPLAERTLVSGPARPPVRSLSGATTMTPERPRHIDFGSAFRVTAVAVVLVLLLGPVADPLCRPMCDARSAAGAGCHHLDADGQDVAGVAACHASALVAAALRPDATRRTTLRIDAGHALRPVGPSLSGGPAFRPLDSYTGSWCQVVRRPRSTVLRI